MRALLDVNVLIALFDQSHVFNDRAHTWLEANLTHGIATCPITENGLIRILSHPKYSQQLRLTPTEVIRRLKNFTSHNNHQFWPDTLSLCDRSVFNTDHILGSKQLTDLYLLALAAEHQGRLVTFDERIPQNCVVKAKSQHLEVA